LKKFTKIFLIVLGIIVIGIGLLVFSFVQSMKPDKKEEEKVRVQAEQYLKDNFDNNFEIFDTLYDNMGNFEFEYAAKVMDNKTKTQFLVYYDDETNQMVDTYIAYKWANDIKTEIRPFIKENFGETTDFFIFFLNENIGQELGIDPLKPRSYKEFDISPTIRITVPRKRSEGDEVFVNEFISYLKSEGKLQHGSVILEYIAENGVILDDEWGKEF
jgi:flagellar basal body-associated protein FliL